MVWFRNMGNLKNELLLTGWCGMCLVCLRLVCVVTTRATVHDIQHAHIPAMQPAEARLKVQIGVDVEFQVIARGRRRDTPTWLVRGRN